MSVEAVDAAPAVRLKRRPRAGSPTKKARLCPNRVEDSALAGREGQHGSGGRRDRPTISVGVGASVPTARVPEAGMEANDTLVQAPDPNLLCPICINVLDNPLRTPCG